MLKLSLVTPEKKITTDLEVEEVILPGHRGQLDVLDRHAPLMTTLQAGILQYRAKGESSFNKVVVSWGYCEVSPTGINVLADTAEVPEEIDKDRAQKALETSQERLKMAGLPTEETLKFQRKERRAQVRIDAAE